jgi:hypothetical protein
MLSEGRPGVDNVYSMKDGMTKHNIAFHASLNLIRWLCRHTAIGTTKGGV